ncbi:MAG: GntR family transcriptional regulator [Pseudomonadota bacterium]
MYPDRNVILDSIRERICLIPPGDVIVLKEKQLADEFGLSRTPIRQILQTLASEGMIEVRPGYGSITTQLNPAERSLHWEVFKQLSLASMAVLGNSPLTEAARMELSAINGFSASLETPSPQLYLRMHARLVFAMTCSVKDPILRLALQSAQWRTVRWRTDDMMHDLQSNWDMFRVNIGKTVDMAVDCSAAELLQMAVGAADRYREPNTIQPI